MSYDKLKRSQSNIHHKVIYMTTINVNNMPVKTFAAFKTGENAYLEVETDIRTTNIYLLRGQPSISLGLVY